MKKSLLLSTVFALTLAGPAMAQNSANGWMDRATNAMNSPAGQQVLQSISGQTTTGSTASATQIGNGLKEALSIGTKNVVTQLGKNGGFNADPKIRIPLPGAVQKLTETLNANGMGGMTTDLENRMNTAAEQAMPQAATLFAGAIKAMTIKDAQTILQGPNNAATQYLRKTMGAQLVKDMQPTITSQLTQAGALQAYDSLAAQMPLMATMSSTLKSNMNSYVANKAVDGVFYYVGQQEAAIRTDPAKQTTALLKTVFGKK